MTNKIALVTGGSRGLGKNMALALAKKGTDIILTYNQQASEADEVVAQIRSLGRKAAVLQLNVADSTSFDAFFQNINTMLNGEFGTTAFDFMINNAGIGLYAPLAEFTENDF